MGNGMEMYFKKLVGESFSIIKRKFYLFIKSDGIQEINILQV